ncbi:MAG: ferrous iron transport protein A [Schwartzia sp.]|nr:ferrous iron transport protein A [Schwartzia sp. (in: firmicutes)]
MTLSEGTPGTTLRIRSIGDSELKSRLMTMGLIPGTPVTVLRSAPLGDPMAIRVRSYNLALRRDDAGRIEVEPAA